MTRCEDWVPTVVHGGFVGDEIARADRHIISSLGPDGAWTLCGRWIPLGRLRILSRNPEAHTMRVREELQRVEDWPFVDCHSRCAERHLYEKRRYKIGSGLWTWLWHRPSPPPAVVTVDEAKQRLAALETALRRPRLPWWRRLFKRAA